MKTDNGIFYTDTNTDLPPLLFIHGYTCDHSDWDNMAHALHKNFRIITTDLIGHGQSAKGQATIDAMGREIADLVESLSLESAVLIGHSMGTRAIAHAALSCTSRLSGLIMVDGSRGASSAEHLERVREIRLSASYEDYVRSLFEQMFSAKTSPDIRDRVIARAVAMDEDWAMTLHSNVAEYDAFTLVSTLNTLNLPMLVVQTTTRDDAGGRAMLSAGDTTAYTDLLQAHFSATPSRVAIIANTSHFPQFEEPAELSRLIGEFAGQVQ